VRWAIGTAALAVGFALIVLFAPSPSAIGNLAGLNADQLAAEKVRQEIIELDRQNRVAVSSWGPLLTLVPVLTALLGGAAIVVTIWKQISERSYQQTQDRRERDREKQRQAHESLKTTTENLAADRPALRAAAAAILPTFLRPEYSAYHDEVLFVALAKSKRGMEDDPNVQRLITRALELAFHERLAEIPSDQRRYALDLSHCDIQRIHLEDLDLTEVDLGYACLDYATLSGARLFRANGIRVGLKRARLGASKKGPAHLGEARLREAQAPGAQLHNAICVSARFEDADLRGAEFHQAKLQEAHFDGADLRGAKFYQANLTNAYFRNCPLGEKIDDAALRTIAASEVNWADQAHFDTAVEARLRELREER
jgi:uncharacterized protein YjbI with pentapeptide repeats